MPVESKEVLTIAEIAVVLRCSKVCVKHALDGKLMGLPRMEAHIRSKEADLMVPVSGANGKTNVH